jgi:hypothetical protein
VGPGLLIQIANDICLTTSTIVFDWFSASLGEEFDSGVRRDTLVFGCGLGILSFSVDFGDNNVWLIDEISSSLLPNWCKRFTVYLELD